MQIRNNFILFILLLFCVKFLPSQNIMNSIYDFQVKTIDGDIFNFSDLKGKKIMIVNTASKCGLTNQYKGLQLLHEKYNNDNFEIIAFPSNDFLNQEPGSNSQIKQFCQSKYDVSFMLFEKINVKGKNQHPLYVWLTQKKYNKVMNCSVKWNFQKFLIDEQGNLVDCLSPKTNPNSKEIISWIEN